MRSDGLCVYRNILYTLLLLFIYYYYRTTVDLRPPSSDFSRDSNTDRGNG